MKKVILAAVAAMTMSTGAQADLTGSCGFGSDANLLNLSMPLEHGATLYSNEELHKQGFGYKQFKGSPFFEYISTTGMPIIYNEFYGKDVCSIPGNRFIRGYDYDQYDNNPYGYKNRHQIALNNYNTAFNKAASKDREAKRGQQELKEKAYHLALIDHNLKKEMQKEARVFATEAKLRDAKVADEAKLRDAKKLKAISKAADEAKLRDDKKLKVLEEMKASQLTHQRWEKKNAMENRSAFKKVIEALDKLYNYCFPQRKIGD